MHSDMFSRTAILAFGGVLAAVDPGIDGPAVAVNNGDTDGGGSGVSQQSQPPRPSTQAFGRSSRFAGALAEESIGIPPPVPLTRDSGYYGFCEGTLDGALSGGVLDLTTNGFAPNLLPAGYVLSALSLRAEHDCVDEDDQWMVLDTTWQTEDGRFRVWISQRNRGAPVANIIRTHWAEFSYEGSSYSVSIGQIYPFDGPLRQADGRAEPDIAYVEEDPEEIHAALAAVVEALAPNLGEQCFYRQIEGGWESLATLGIGDPCTAIPSDFREEGFWAEVFEPPAAGCDVPTDVHIPVSINASWSDGRNAWIGFSVWGDDSGFGFEEPGSQSEHHISWTDGTYRYEIWGSRGERGLGSEVLEAIARALDSDFDGSCRLVEVELSDGELAALGIGIPEAPDGFTLHERRARGSEANGNCDADIGDGFASGNWTFGDSDGSVIHASAWLQPSHYDEPFPEGGFIGEGHINWQGPNGVAYSVSEWSEFGGLPDQGLLIEVALSMDPTLDIDSLGDGPIAVPLVEPAAVAVDDAAGY